MKTCVVALVVLMVLGSCVSASGSEENLPVKGTKQLMFGFSGWGLSNYKGGVGLRYYIREKTALRFGLDVNWSKDDDFGWRQDDNQADAPELVTDTLDRSAFSVGVGAVLERHFRSSWSVVPYAGLGAFWWYDKYKSDEAFEREQRDEAGSSVYESKGHTVEGLLLAGLQWHFAPNMSLGGEYRLSLKYSRKEYDSTRTYFDGLRVEHDTRKQYDLTVDASRLWLSIAF
ncbi:outer membrane beta-barrel protein [Candidatus Eisenbacteria bacterium]|uniref:Outer membrane beta-barrel protein n=1 Tax=Eiseniibacteriota bacterium TaxID=2212470 RepID=A0ABV6YN66_UNCEI